ncbi:MAG TPA: ferredoxin--nitrite reductase, partial [Blastocatellia bacterium]|nr:ferredoxin--nitrite reductase [Blastocatellia bacterium]
WAGVFFRKQTPGFFMMRLRMPGGRTNTEQLGLIADISDDCGKGFVDITTRQQIQLRWFQIGKVPDLFKELERAGLTSLQTGMDNIRNVVGCAAAGLTANELFDASPAVREYTSMFVGNREYTNLPRKFNVAISGCLENCTHAESQDVAMTPAVRLVKGEALKGFNVAAGGKMGSGGYRPASPLDLFVLPDEAAEICRLITLIFRDHGFRTSRARARLAFLIDEWGVGRFRRELEARAGYSLSAAGRDARTDIHADHVGIFRQRQPGLNFIGFVVPVGRITSGQLREVARLAKDYGNGDIRITTGQNLIIPNVPDNRIVALSEEPLFKVLRYDPSEVMRGTVSCTGIDYCSLALIETKELAMKTARELEKRIGKTKPITIHWSGCPAGCGNHAAADIGLLGKNVRVGHDVVEVADVFVGGKAGPSPRPPIRLLENVPCSDLPRVLEQLVPNLSASVAASRGVRSVTRGANTSGPTAMPQAIIDETSADDGGRQPDRLVD